MYMLRIYPIASEPEPDFHVVEYRVFKISLGDPSSNLIRIMIYHLVVHRLLNHVKIVESFSIPNMTLAGTTISHDSEFC